MATSKKPEKDPGKNPIKDSGKEEVKDIQLGLDVHPSMPYYCTWLPGACPEGATEGKSPFTRPPLCPPAGAGAATIIPTIVPPCPTMPQVCVPTINPPCPKPADAEAHEKALAQTQTIITCTGIPIICGVHEQAQTLRPTTTVNTLPFCPTITSPVATCPPPHLAGAQAQVGTVPTTIPTANTHCFICPPPGTIAQAQLAGTIGHSAIIINCPTQHGPATVCGITTRLTTTVNTLPFCPTVTSPVATCVNVAGPAQAEALKSFAVVCSFVCGRAEAQGITVTAATQCTQPPGCMIGITGWHGCIPTGTATTTIPPNYAQGAAAQAYSIGDTWCNPACPTKGNPTCPGEPQITLLTAPPTCTGIQTNACTIGNTGWYTCTQTGTGPQPAAVTLATVCTQTGCPIPTTYTQPFGHCPIGTDATVCTQYGCPQPTITDPVATCPITIAQGGAQAQGITGMICSIIPTACIVTAIANCGGAQAQAQVPWTLPNGTCGIGPVTTGGCFTQLTCPGAQAQAVPHPTTTTTFLPLCDVTRNATVCTIATTCTQVPACPGGVTKTITAPTLCCTRTHPICGDTIPPISRITCPTVCCTNNPPATVCVTVQHTQPNDFVAGPSVIVLNCPTNHPPATVCITRPTDYGIRPSAIVLNCPTGVGIGTICPTPTHPLATCPQTIIQGPGTQPVTGIGCTLIGFHCPPRQTQLPVCFPTINTQIGCHIQHLATYAGCGAHAQTLFPTTTIIMVTGM